MQELLFGSLGLQAYAYAQQHPWRVFAAVLVAILMADLLFRKRSSRSGDGGAGGDFDFGFGDGGCDGGGGD